MTIAVISPHLDDAAFSLSEHLSVRPGTVIITAYGGIPNTSEGKAKYERLHEEHIAACELLQAAAIDGPFLDDAAGYADMADVIRWLDAITAPFAEVWIPVGIHHPNHILTNKAAYTIWSNRRGRQKLRLYEELPYRVLYPIGPLKNRTLDGSPTALEFKKKVCRSYASQINDDIERCLYVPERTWMVN